MLEFPSGSPDSSRRSLVRRPLRTRVALTTQRLAAAFSLSVLLPALFTGQRSHDPQSGLTDAEFWEFFTTRSEAGGTFSSENFVSNEMTFQQVIPTLQHSLTPGGVYLGVGPEQNFTYIANLKPRLAVIFDIRRQNAMQHLMYKAVFELSPTRAEFVSRLFSRPRVARLGTSIAVKALFDSALAADAPDATYQANRSAIFNQLMRKHGFALSADDSASIERVYGAFYHAGPDINYGFRSSVGMLFQSIYPTFGMLQAATNADSVQMAFLASEENYRAVRDLEVRNLIVPVVGDFGGATAIRSVGDYVKRQGMKVTAFYVSNVEQYLFRDGVSAERFYGNLSALPIDSTSTIIRSVPPNGMNGMTSFMGGPATVVGSALLSGGTTSASYFYNGTTRVSIVDSGGVRITRTTRDSAGVPVITVQRDSSPNRPMVFSISPAGISPPSNAPMTAQDSVTARVWKQLNAMRDSMQAQFRSSGMSGQSRFGGPMVTSAGLLASGIATIHDTMDRFFGGRLQSYSSVIEMTKTSGWK